MLNRDNESLYVFYCDMPPHKRNGTGIPLFGVCGSKTLYRLIKLDCRCSKEYNLDMYQTEDFPNGIPILSEESTDMNIIDTFWRAEHRCVELNRQYYTSWWKSPLALLLGLFLAVVGFTVGLWWFWYHYELGDYYLIKQGYERCGPYRGEALYCRQERDGTITVVRPE